jgi:hypothetical protein
MIIKRKKYRLGFYIAGFEEYKFKRFYATEKAREQAKRGLSRSGYVIIDKHHRYMID